MGKTENSTMANIADQHNGKSRRKYYFAYGSNCHVSSMLSRCPAATCIGKSVLPDHRMVLRTVADIQASDGHSVHGALWAITRQCEIALNRYEGFPHHYKKRQVTVIHDVLGDLSAMVYVMVGRACQEPPRAEYRDVIAQGYVDLGISLKQLNVAVLEAHHRFNDDIERIRRNELDY